MPPRGTRNPAPEPEDKKGKGTGNPAMDKWLKSMKSKWAEQATKAGDAQEFEQVPDGIYVFRLVSAKIGESSNGRRQIVWKSVVVQDPNNDEQVGNFAFDTDGIETEENLYWVGRKLKRFGVNPAEVNFEELQEALDEIAESHPAFKGRVFTKEGSDFSNLKIQRVYEEDEAEDIPGVEDVTEEDDGDGTEAPEVGDEVTFTEGKETLTGIVKAVDEDEKTATVKVGRKTYEVPFANIQTDDEDDDSSDDPSYEAGDEVTFELEGDEVTGTIKAVDEDERELTVKVGKKTHTVSFDDVIQGVEVQIGMEVDFPDPKNAKKTLTGTVTAKDEDEGTVTVKVGNKSYPDISVDDLTLIEDDE